MSTPFRPALEALRQRSEVPSATRGTGCAPGNDGPRHPQTSNTCELLTNDKKACEGNRPRQAQPLVCLLIEDVLTCLLIGSLVACETLRMSVTAIISGL